MCVCARARVFRCVVVCVYVSYFHYNEYFHVALCVCVHVCAFLSKGVHKSRMAGNFGASEAGPSSPVMTMSSPVASPGLDMSAISLHIAMDTPPRECTPAGEGHDEVATQASLQFSSPSIAAPRPAPGGTQGHVGEMRTKIMDAIGRSSSADIDGRGAALQTPKNSMSSPTAMQRQTWSTFSSSSAMSTLQLQTPSHRRGELAQSEQELAAKSGALICLYSQDMAPLVSVAHGMQLPRAQIGLLGACFTSCRSNAFELNKVRAGDSTIAYRSLLGGDILAVIVLSSWGGSSGSLLDSMLEYMHDSVWAAVKLVVSEQTVRQLLEANKVSQVRKALKPATLLFQHLLTGRTEVSLLTRFLGAISQLSAANSVKASHALHNACAQLAVPGPPCACILADGKLVCATWSWCQLGAARQSSAAARDQTANSTVHTQTQMMLLHMLATDVAADTNVVVMPVHGLPLPRDQPDKITADHVGLGDSRACARRQSGKNSAVDGHCNVAAASGVAQDSCGADGSQTRQRLLVVGMTPASLAGHIMFGRGGSGEHADSSDVRLCVLLPGDASLFAVPMADELDGIRTSLEMALYPVMLNAAPSPAPLPAPSPWPSSGESISLSLPCSQHAQSDSNMHGPHTYLRRDAHGSNAENENNLSANSMPNPAAQLVQSGLRGSEVGVFETEWWYRLHPCLCRIVMLRRGNARGGGTSHPTHCAAPFHSGLDLFWELEAPEAASQGNALCSRMHAAKQGGNAEEGKWHVKSELDKCHQPSARQTNASILL